RAGLPSLNKGGRQGGGYGDLQCFYSNDGGSGARNPVGDFVFPILRRPMRSTTS
ncbi:Hypothetical protein FKW44_024948, partial [Caligus rogercresseyi]